MLPRLLLRGRNFVSACLIRLDVRFLAQSGRRASPLSCLLLTHSGHSYPPCAGLRSVQRPLIL